MDDADAERQINQMVSFILAEARAKAQEIEAKSLEDFNIEKMKHLQQLKEKTRQEFNKKAKQLETENAIQKSAAINKARLKTIIARQQAVDEVRVTSLGQLQTVAKDEQKYKKLLSALTLQGALAMLEDNIYVRCREEDKALVSTVLENVEKEYTKTVKKQSGSEKSLRVTLDKTYLHPGSKDSKHAGKGKPSCAGGVVVYSMDHKISCDNTLDARLRTAALDCLPTVKTMLFTGQKSV